MTPRRASPAALAVLVALLLVLAGCGGSGGGSGGSGGSDDQGGTDVDTSREQLAERPSYEQAERSYEELLPRVVAALARVAPDVAWETSPPVKGTTTACRGDLSDVEGARRSDYGTGGAGAIPDDDWSRAVTAVREVVEPEGFEKYAVVADEPGQHNVSFYGPHGAELVLNGRRSTTVTMYGGCFLLESSRGSQG